MADQKEITVEEIKEIVEIGLDDEIPAFAMDGNWYEEYGMDSLGAIAIVVETQKRFDVRLPDDAMPHIFTGNQLVEQIEKMREALVA